MNERPVSLTNFLVVNLFHHGLFVSSVLWLGALAAIALAFLLVTRRIFVFNMGAGADEPRARTYLRWCFGTFWLIDGMLQFQPSMPLGLANVVVAPLRSGTPSWLHALMNHGIVIWNSHPITLAVGTAWLQVGLGLVLLTSSGLTGRIAGVVSALWAALVWLIGNGGGGVFEKGASILFGWPGATVFYAMAGVWLALPPDVFARRFSTYATRFVSALLVVAAVIQCLPAAGFWRGGNANALTVMTRSMTAIAQPHTLASVVRRAGTLSGVMGGGFNIVVVLWLLACAVGLWLSVRTRWRWPVWTLVVGCLVFWLVGEDAAVYGGLSTDLNSLIPLAALSWCAAPHRALAGARTRRLPREMTSSAGAVVATFASAMVAFSVVSMAWASVAGAENTLFLAENGPASSTNVAASQFTLTDQHHQPYTLGEHAGYVTLLTFLDPKCWTDCPLLANQLKQVRSQLPADTKLDIVAVAANPFHEKVTDLQGFIKKHDLGDVRNFYFVTGSLAQTSKVWSEYGVSVEMQPTDKMSIHSDFIFIIDTKARLRWIIPDTPIPGTPGISSAVTELRVLLATQGIG